MSDETHGEHGERDRYDPGTLEPKWQRVWDEKATHDAALTLPACAALTARVMTLCEAVGSRVESTVIGGRGLASAAG